MKFPTQFDYEKHFTNAGERTKPLYKMCVDEDGVMDLVEYGKDDLYASIQSHKDSVDIHVLLKRFANGDVDALNQRQGMYGDFTEMPQTYAQMLQTVIDAETIFNSLSVEEKAKYNHSFSEYVAALGRAADAAVASAESASVVAGEATAEAAPEAQSEPQASAA